MRRLAPCLALPALVLFSAAAPDDDFQPLVKGTDPAQFRLVELGPDSLSITEEGEIRLTGKPNGYFATKDSYEDYVLRYEFLYERPEGLASDDKFRGNSGVLLNIQEPHKVWPRSIEFQLMNAEVGKIYPIGGAKLEGKWDAEAYKKAIKPVGQWNLEEVSCKDGVMTCTLNGVEVTRGKGADPDRGPIGWQSEGVPIRFRNLMIKKLD
jgi:hypothetical protein